MITVPQAKRLAAALAAMRAAAQELLQAINDISAEPRPPKASTGLFPGFSDDAAGLRAMMQRLDMLVDELATPHQTELAAYFRRQLTRFTREETRT